MGYKGAIDTRLPLMPDDSLDPKLFKEVLMLYQSIRLMNSGFSEATGLVGADQADFKDIPPANSVKIGNNTRFYAQATEAMQWGTLCALTTDGTNLQVKKAFAGNYLNNLFTPAQCICESTNGLVTGEWGEFRFGPHLTNGIVGAEGLPLATGAWYYLSDSEPGKITYEIPQYERQVVGFGISSSSFYFMPNAHLIIARP